MFRKLKAFGAQEGDTVRIRETEFDYIDEDALDAADAVESDEDDIM